MSVETIVQEILKEIEENNSENLIVIGSDHGGFEYKEFLKPFLKELGYSVLDCGCYSKEPVDYPDFAYKTGKEFFNKSAKFGIFIDGAGIGSAIVLNKIKGIRAAHCSNTFEAYNARAHNNANFLTLGSRVIGTELMKLIVERFLNTEFEGGRHLKRVNKIIEIDNANR